MKRDTEQTKNNETNENPALFRLFRHFSFVSCLSLVLLTYILGVSACSRAPRTEQPTIRRYELKGRVESLDFEGKHVTIAHENIKDYMDAMTMSFAVKDESILRKLKSGDRLQATLVYDSSTNLSWLEDIKVISTN
ncbi:MAG: copper-binding protein [Acidobacteria bacterium]|nr:copper-binding protein [Acidobacteriota bacterium]